MSDLPELHISSLSRLLAHGLQLRGQRVDVPRDHGHAISGPVGLANDERCQGGPVAGDVVLAAGLDLVGPVVAGWEL